MAVPVMVGVLVAMLTLATTSADGALFAVKLTNPDALPVTDTLIDVPMSDDGIT